MHYILINGRNTSPAARHLTASNFPILIFFMLQIFHYSKKKKKKIFGFNKHPIHPPENFWLPLTLDSQKENSQIIFSKALVTLLKSSFLMRVEGGGQHIFFPEIKRKNASTEKLQETVKCFTGDFQMQSHLGAGYKGPGNPQTHLPASWGGLLKQLSHLPHISTQNDLWREMH